MSVADLKQALTNSKTAERLAANDAGTVRGKAEVYPKPPGREDGLNAHWGDAPAPPLTLGTAAVEAADEGREKMIERLFSGSGSSSTAEKALLKEVFNPETVSEAHTPHSALLRRGRDKLASREDETLAEQTYRVTGLR